MDETILQVIILFYFSPNVTDLSGAHRIGRVVGDALNASTGTFHPNVQFKNKCRQQEFTTTLLTGRNVFKYGSCQKNSPPKLRNRPVVASKRILVD